MQFKSRAKQISPRHLFIVCWSIVYWTLALAVMLAGCTVNSSATDYSTPPLSTKPTINENTMNFAVPPTSTGMSQLGSVAFSSLLGVGWNLGNSLEAVKDGVRDETIWGNPVINRQLIKAVKDAGFKTVRLPVSWSDFSDPATFTISQTRMKRVAEVVDLLLEHDLYVMMNLHWDGGWLIPTYEKQVYGNQRLHAIWTQVATYFREYDSRVFFAGTNEVMFPGDYGLPSQEYYTVQNGFNQTFVNAVRATGGRNVYRHLVVQGFNTNINATVKYATLPADIIDDRLMMEVHFYDPYEFAIDEYGADKIPDTEDDNYYWQWGKITEDPTHRVQWPLDQAETDEAYIDMQFNKMKQHFVDKGVGVILGEYGAIWRSKVDPAGRYRNYWNEVVTRSALEHHLVPVYWDNGDAQNDLGMGLFDRSSGEQVHPALIDAILRGARLASQKSVTR